MAPRRNGVKGERMLRRLPMVSESHYGGEMGDTDDEVCAGRIRGKK